MSKDVEDRLRRALVSRAEQVTAESLRPSEPPHRARRKGAWGTAGGSRWTTWRTPILAATAAATVAAGLALVGNRGPDDRVPPANESIVVTGSEGARELEMVTVALEDGGVSADVDGDGAPDKVVTAVDGEASSKCRAFVAVRTASGSTYSTAMAPPAVPPSGVNADVVAIPDLGADGRADIVVDTHLMADGVLA